MSCYLHSIFAIGNLYAWWPIHLWIHSCCSDTTSWLDSLMFILLLIQNSDIINHNLIAGVILMHDEQIKEGRNFFWRMWSYWQRLSVVPSFYRTAIRPAMLYGAECWSTKRRHVQQLSVAEMRMLRWFCGHTRRDRVRNEAIQHRLRWFGHVQTISTDVE